MQKQKETGRPKRPSNAFFIYYAELWKSKFEPQLATLKIQADKIKGSRDVSTA